MQLAGDRWSLLILRDVAMHDRRSRRDLLTGSEQGISAPLLSRRLKDLPTAGFLRKEEARYLVGGCRRGMPVAGPA
ncbi:winged helix-turn-helix transcriptional regulator, partial [Actinomyces radicidentis]